MVMLSVVLVFVVLVLVWLVLNQPVRGPDLPPGPKGLPLVGSIFELAKWSNPNKFFRSLGERYGPVVSLQVGLTRLIVINDFENLQSAFVKQGESFNTKPKEGLLNKIMNGYGILFSEGQRWQETRRFVLRYLRDRGMGRRDIEPRVQLEVRQLLEVMQRKSHSPVNLHLDLCTAVLNIVFALLAGRRYKWDNPALHRMVWNISQSLKALDQVTVFNYLPAFLQAIRMMFRKETYSTKRNVDEIYASLELIIEDHRSAFREGVAPGETDDYTTDECDPYDDLIFHILEDARVKKAQGHGSVFTDPRQVRHVVCDMLVAGMETMVSSLRWFLLFVALHPEVQNRLQRELDARIEPGEMPSHSDRVKFPYLEAVMTETFRLGTVVHSVVHATTHNTVLGPYVVPAGSWVLANMWGMYRDPSLFPNPEEFRPSRFLDEDGQFLRPEHIVPFSIGRRSCLAESLARVEMFCFSSSILRYFHVSLPEGESAPDLGGSYGVTLNPFEYRLTLRPRTDVFSVGS